MELNTTDLEANETINQVIRYFNISITNLTNQSEETQMKLFDLYEAYKTKEREQLITYRLVAYIVGTLIVLSNITVVISSGLILKKGQQPKSTYLLLGNVSLADTIIGISIIFGALVDNDMSSNSMCIFQIGMLVCPAMVSIFSVGMIAVDRYIYILHGLYYQRWFNTTKVRIGIVCIWMIGITLGFMPATGWVNKELHYSRCYYVGLFPGGLILLNSLLSIVPIIVVAVLYIIILIKALRNVKNIKAADKPVKNGPMKEPKLRIYRGNAKVNGTYSGLFIASLPAMGWTGKTFTDYRCWYVALFPASLLIIVSVVVLSVIVMVCVLYILILHSAVKTVDKIKERREINSIAFVNRAYEDECKKIDEVKTRVTITLSTETIQTNDSIEMHELCKTNIEQKKISNIGRLRRKVSKVTSYYGQAKAMNSHPSKLRAVKTVLIVILCFVGTWAPYYVTIIIYVKCDIMKNGYDCVPLEMLTLGPLYLLGTCNSLCDPVIYAWRHSGFKRTLRKMYWKYILSLKH